MNHFERLLLRFVNTEFLAPEFDVGFYQTMHSDLASFDVEAARRHYTNYGRSEGRIASPAGHRIGFTGQLPKDGTILEIGPAVRPVLRGANVRYFDIASSAGLIERAIAEGYDPQACPEIHYVSPTGDLSTINDQFRAVFSSHCIEHQPDLVTHLQNVSRLLAPAGRYFLIVPDRRYCFDALLPNSKLEEVLQAYDERRRVHTWSKVHEHYTLTTHNDTPRHWAGDSDDPDAGLRGQRALEAERKFAAAAGGYVDVHAWQFTPGSFADICDALSSSGLIDLTLERIHHPIRNSNEFFAVLARPRISSEPRHGSSACQATNS